MKLWFGYRSAHTGNVFTVEYESEQRYDQYAGETERTVIFEADTYTEASTKVRLYFAGDRHIIQGYVNHSQT